MHKKLKFKCVTEDTLHKSKHINHFIFLYWHFDRILIDGIVVAEYNDYDTYDSDYSESEQLVYDDDAFTD